jgi:polyhydroxyalkanoate synthase subunit PhaC
MYLVDSSSQQPETSESTPAAFVKALAHTPDLIQRGGALAGEVAAAIYGRSTLEPLKGDRRFTDPAWSGNPIFSRIERGYLATAQAVGNVVGELGQSSDNQRRAEQARFATTILTSALAPTNFLATNPAAIKRAFDTGGKSLVRGVRNFVGDVRNNGGMPSMVERDAFEVGKDLALSPGAVVHRDEVGELIQYQPSTEQVHKRPLVIIPPPIGRFYFLDLRPGRSFS